MGKINEEALAAALAELDSLGGLEEVKSAVRRIADVGRVNAMREEFGLPSARIIRHMLFLGNPGTGKSTVARIVGKIYSALGVLSKGHVVESDRSQMVGGYIGASFEKTKQIIEKARGGILYIDAASTLFRDMFGEEALNALHIEMSDNGSDIAVIFADYEDALLKAVSSNPAIDVKVPVHIYFSDLTPDELYSYFCRIMKKHGCVATEDADAAIKEYFVKLCEQTDRRCFGNAREADRLFEDIFSRQINKLTKENRLSKEAVRDITRDLIPEFKK